MRSGRPREWHPAPEEYCAAIHQLAAEQDEVLQARLAERLGVSPPSVSEKLQHLRREGLVEAGPGPVVLTSAGRRLAEQVARRHDLAERFMTQVLGLAPDLARHEAGKWEHVISPRVEEALARVLGWPA